MQSADADIPGFRDSTLLLQMLVDTRSYAKNDHEQARQQSNDDNNRREHQHKTQYVFRDIHQFNSLEGERVTLPLYGPPEHSPTRAKGAPDGAPLSTYRIRALGNHRSLAHRRVKNQLIVALVNQYGLPFGDLSSDQLHRQRIEHFLLDHPLQRSRAVNRVIPH